jgi:hypothetical protein|tara:strand:- start:480 stop:935 length:456 start_codon:yes stop_codon:yes gene_type:complete
MATKRKKGGPSAAMAEELELEYEEEEVEEEEVPATPEFDFTKYRIVNKTEIRTLELDGANFNVTLKPLSWSKRNQILSKAMTWTTDGGSKFDGDVYVRECLKEMIIDAPWGKTTELFLMSIDDRLGGVLETVVPQAFGTEEIGDLETLKDG